MAIKSISEFTIQSGRRDEFMSLFQSLVGPNLSTLHAAGCSGPSLYAVVDDPERLIEIADWESAQARIRRSTTGPSGHLRPCSRW